MPGLEGAIQLPIPGTRACFDNAHKLLQRHGHEVKEVHAVDPDSILFTDSHGRAKTAWVTITYSALQAWGTPLTPLNIDIEDGFQI